jgi:hypothetical protein
MRQSKEGTSLSGSAAAGGVPKDDTVSRQSPDLTTIRPAERRVIKPRRNV